MSHIGLYVTDMKQSVSFYTRVLGLSVLEDRGVGASDPDSNIRPHRGPFDHMALYVDDIESEVNRIKGFGVAFSPDQIMTVLDSRKIAFFNGPDGERMELVQKA